MIMPFDAVTISSSLQSLDMSCSTILISFLSRTTSCSLCDNLNFSQDFLQEFTKELSDQEMMIYNSEGNIRNVIEQLISKRANKIRRGNNANQYLIL